MSPISENSQYTLKMMSLNVIASCPSILHVLLLTQIAWTQILLNIQLRFYFGFQLYLLSLVIKWFKADWKQYQKKTVYCVSVLWTLFEM